jgi:hypothetical protein
VGRSIDLFKTIKKENMSFIKIFFSFLIVLALFTNCSTHEKKKSPIPKEHEILAKYPGVLNKFKDTLVVLNAFKYLEIDTTYLKEYLVALSGREVSYDTDIYDSLLWYKYGLRPFFTNNDVLYFYLFSMKMPKFKNPSLYFPFYKKIWECTNYIKDTLHIKDKLDFQEIFMLSKKLTFEKWLREYKYDINKINHVNLFDDKDRRPVNNLVQNNTRIFYNNKEATDSIDYQMEWYECYTISLYKTV